MTIKKVEVFSSDRNIIIIDGEKYIMEVEKVKKIDGVMHSDKVIFKKFNEGEYNKNLDIIVDALAKKTDNREILRDLVKKIDYAYLRRIAKRIKEKKPIKKQEGCLGFKVGDAYVPLLD